MEGLIADDAAFLRLRTQYLNMMFYNMRTKGYVPILDVADAFSTSWNGESYDFTLTVHGVYYGQQKARKIYGLTGDKEIPME